MTIRVLLVDDDALVRAGLRLMLRSAADIEVTGEAGDGAVAVAAAAEQAPDVILMDIRMPGVDGVTATSQITTGEITTGQVAPRVIALTTFDADDLVRAAITAGAVGYLVKDTPPAEIIGAIRAVAAGHGVLSPAVTRPLLDLLHGPASAAPPGPGLDALTEREREVARAVADGGTNAEIAGQLYVSAATVKATVSRILTKLGLDNRVQIAGVVHGSGPATSGQNVGGQE